MATPNSDWQYFSKFYKFILLFALLVLVAYIFLSPSQSLETYSESSKHESEAYPLFNKHSAFLEKLTLKAVSDFKYSVWPSFLDTRDLSQLKNLDQNFFLSECCDSKMQSSQMSIENMKDILSLWSSSKNEKCQLFFKLFSLLFDVKFKENHLSMDGEFAKKVDKMLGNNQELMKIVYNQVFIFILVILIYMY